MAEILLSLTIIGVVAAITLPSLTGNINERTWNTQRKALYARISQAISLMPALNGYGTLVEDASGNVIEDTVAETFVTDGLSKVLKINNICDSEHLEDCGIPKRITTMAQGNVVDFPIRLSEFNSEMTSVSGVAVGNFSAIDSKVAAFETQNGESIAVFYNPSCLYSSAVANDVSQWNYQYFQNWYCVNFIYDLNGNRGPNTFNKDLGTITVFFATDSLVVAPVPYSNIQRDTNDLTFPKICNKVGDEYRVPNIYEAISLYMNKNLYNLNLEDGMMTSSQVYSPFLNSMMYWALHPGGGNIIYTAELYRGSTYCVKR